jgi:hypothetical protein
MGENGVRHVEERRAYQHGLRGLRGRKQGALRRSLEASSSLPLHARLRHRFFFPYRSVVKMRTWLFAVVKTENWFVAVVQNEKN